MNRISAPLCMLILLGTQFFLNGCSSKKNEDALAPVPLANFTFKMLGAVPPADVDFTNISKNTTSYLWDFGDNTTSIIASPKHTYAKTGTYTVKLTATGPGGVSQVEDQINIGAKKMIINALVIDSAVQVANPVYFFATIGIDQINQTLGDYYLPLSNVPYYPTAAWSDLKYSVALQSEVQIKLFYKLPGNQTGYPAGDNVVNSFRFKPSELIKDNAVHPTRVSFANGSGATQNKITMVLSWE